MSSESVRVKYMGATPGADALTYVIFDTTVAFPAPGYAPLHKLKRLDVSLSNTGAGTYNWYKSQTRLATPSATPVWTQIGTAAVAAGATASNDNDFLIEPMADFKLEFVNGGVAQAVWLVDIALSGERTKST